MQLQKAAAVNIIPATSGVGYARSALETSSCLTCDIKNSCLAQQLTMAHHHSSLLRKNKKLFAKGKHIFRGEDVANDLYIVSSGSVKSYILMEDGEEQMLNFYMPGDIFGLDSMASNRHVSSTIALEDTTICKLPLSGLKNRVIGREFFNIVSEWLLHDHNLMLMLARKDADGRLASFLVDLLRRIEKHGEPVDMIRLTMTRQDIANYLGLAIETVSRALRRFQDSGTLEITRRSIKIYDYNSLLKIAGVQVSY